MKKKINISINIINLIFSLLLFGTFIVFLFISYQADLKFNRAKRSIEKFIACENSSKIISQNAQILSEQANLFVITKNPEYAKRFLAERSKNENQKAMRNLQSFCNSDDLTYQRLEIAIGQADNLYQLELYAIKLIYEAEKDVFNFIPAEIQKIDLSETDKLLSKNAKEQKAVDILYGDGAFIYRQRITNNCTIILKDLETSIKKDLHVDAQDLGEHLHQLEFTQIFCFLICIMIFIIYAFWVFIPVKKYKTAMQMDQKIEPSGSSELIYLGNAYNAIYDSKSNHEKELLINSSTDALTGSYNRRAFEQICKENSTPDVKLALIIIDIDNFKSINDTFGHAVGDKALKHLSNCLNSTFRKDDYICRIGGDEFAVILTNFSKENKSAISTKMNFVKEKLSSRANDIPRFTISAGASISETGFSDEMFKQADGALYIIKNTGKNGCFVFSENN